MIFLTSMLGAHMQTDNLVYDKHMRLVRSLPVGASRNGQDRDHVVELCNEVVKDGHSCLIFCPTKKNCEVGGPFLIKKISVYFTERQSF
jgi:replicative superfamily II helicase